MPARLLLPSLLALPSLAAAGPVTVIPVGVTVNGTAGGNADQNTGGLGSAHGATDGTANDGGAGGASPQNGGGAAVGPTFGGGALSVTSFDIPGITLVVTPPRSSGGSASGNLGISIGDDGSLLIEPEGQGGGDVGGGEGGISYQQTSGAVGGGGGGGGSMATRGLGGGGGGAVDNSSPSTGSAAGGGGGGVGMMVSGALTINGTLSGGAGGNGGATDGTGGSGGSGGSGGIGGGGLGGGVLGGTGDSPEGGGGGGGAGVYADANGRITISNTGSVIGGQGGNVPARSDPLNQMGGGGGGGAGILGSGFHVDNAGTISGGAGGDGLAAGGGGVGVAGDHFTLINEAGAIIQGGASGSGPTQNFLITGASGVVSTGGATVITAGRISGRPFEDLSGNPQMSDAVMFKGGGNTLILENGYAFDGNVTSSSGAANGGDTLGLGGDITPAAAFDLSQVGAGLQFQGFTQLTKTGASTWTLAGTTTLPWTIAGGELAVDSDAELGAPSAALMLDGGLLRVTGTAYTTTTRPIVMGAAGGGFDIADAGNTFSLSSSLSGPGGFTKAGAGTLLLAAAQTYSGTTEVAGGTLRAGQAGALSATSPYVVDSGAVLDLNNYDQSIASLAGAGTVNLGTGALATGSNGADTAFSGNLVGTGTLTKTGNGTFSVSGSSTGYAGTTQVTAGTLQADGTLGGSLVIGSKATLTGTGTVGGTMLQSGATLSPGNAATTMGTLTTKGDLTFAPGSIYRVDTATDGGHDSVHVTGTANLAGSVVDVTQGGPYAASTRYTILTADGGIHGTFDALSHNVDLAFLAPVLAYDSNQVNLVMQTKGSFAGLAMNGNQRAVANALQSLPTSSALYTRVLNLPSGAPAAVFESLSGETHASTVSVLQGVTDNVASLPLSHLRANLDANQSPGPATAQLGMGDASALPRSAAQPVWAQVFGNWRTLGGGDASKVSESDGGLFVGGDHGVGAGWRLGGALGYTGSHSSVQGHSSSTDVDSYSVTVYGGKAFDAGPGKINLMLGSAYTWHDIKSQRTADAAGENQELDASYGASTGQVFTELGYALPLNDRVTLEPFAGADYSDTRTRGFSESGGDAALNGEHSRNDVTTTTLGLHAQTTFESDSAEGRLHGTVGWRHAFGDVDPHTTMSFDGSQSFTVAGAPIAHDAAVLELGVDMAVTRNTTVGVAYNGQFGAGNQQNSGSINVSWRF